MTKPLIDKETAIADVDRWLDYKKIGRSKREQNKIFIDQMVEAVVDGDLVLDEDCKWTYTLKFPLENEVPVRTISFKPRVNLKDINDQLSKVKGGSGSDLMVVYAAVLSGQVKEVIRNFDTEDYNTISAIVIFFM